jgi:cytochrome c oxidase subunit 2
MSVTGPTNPPAEGIKIGVNGFRWWWEIQYNEGAVKTASELHIPAGQVVNVDLGSDNVIHSFWVPRIMGKTDTMPGHTNRTWLLTDQPGIYDGQCAEFCGSQHANMLFRVIVQTPAEFQEWLASQELPPVEPAPGSIQATGKEILLNPDKKCIGCHAIQGTTAQGITGPNLTHFASRGCFAGCMFENNHDNLTRWLQNPQAMKPDNLMVIDPLTPDEINALTAYLESLR